MPSAGSSLPNSPHPQKSSKSNKVLEGADSNKTLCSTYIFKVVLVGESGVGKTGLLLRFIDRQFSIDHQSTIGVDFKIKTLESGYDHLKLVIWDTAGQERYRALNKIYYRSANAVILVYDVTRPFSFQQVNSWLDQLRAFAHSDVLVWLVANKMDDQAARRVSKEEGRDLARTEHLFFIETSARDGVGVDELFYSIAHELWTRALHKDALLHQHGAGIKLEDVLKKNYFNESILGGCCPF